MRLILVGQIALGAGFGLLSTPLLVGVQAKVTWRERGVVTGANIFSRYLGQSLGAAMCGAIFNNAIARELVHAPSALRLELPRSINTVTGALQSHSVHGTADEYLRHALYTATPHVYTGLVAIAVLTLGSLLRTPRRFPVVDQSADHDAGGAEDHP